VEKNLSIKQLYKHGRVAGGRGVGHSAAAGAGSSATRSSRSDASGANAAAAVRQRRLQQQLYHRVAFPSRQPQSQPPTPTDP